MATPALPQVLVNSTYTPGGRQVLTDGTLAGLQAALDAATPGDVLVVPAGAKLVGTLTLRNKGDAQQFISIVSSAIGRLPGPGLRVQPSDAPNMAKIAGNATDPTIICDAGAHHYRFIGMEIASDWDQNNQTTPGTAICYNIVLLEKNGGNVTLADCPTDIMFDRCYVHGTPTGDVVRGILLNGIRQAVVDSYVSEIHSVGRDSQGLCGINGPGPFKIVNNTISAAAENIMFGGGDPSIQNLVPSDIEVRNNTLTKSLTWKADDPSYANIPWTVKNLFELKNAQRVLVDSNLFEYNWTMAQNGFAILFTVRNQDGTAPWSNVSDVTFTNNHLRHAGAGINTMGTDYLQPSAPSQRILIRNNLLEDLGGSVWTGPGDAVQIASGGDDLVIDHNTFMQVRFGVIFTGVYPPPATIPPVVGFVYTNNVLPALNANAFFGDYGIGVDNVALATFAPGAVVQGNVIVASTPPNLPPGNFYPPSFDAVQFTKSLSSISPYKKAGTDGKDCGASFVLIPQP